MYTSSKTMPSVMVTSLLILAIFMTTSLQSEDDTSTDVTKLDVLKTRVNWETRSVTLGVASSGELRSVLDRAGVQNSQFQVVAANRKTPTGKGLYGVTGSIDDFLKATRIGTRSVWLAGKRPGERFRVDLPVPEITGLRVRKSEDEGQGPKVRITATGLLPGYQVMHRGDESAGEERRPTRVGERPLADLGWKFPHISAVENGPEGSHYVWVQFAAVDDAAVAHSLSIVNRDGSRSRTLTVTQRGSDFERSSTERPFPPRPLPLDEAATVPSVELLTVEEAATRVREAGLQPVVVDLRTLRETPIAGQSNQVVVRQGLTSNTSTRQGELLLLGVGHINAHGVELETDFSLTSVDHAPPIDVDDDGGVVTADGGDGTIDFEPDVLNNPSEEDDWPIERPEETPDWEIDNPPPIDIEPDVASTAPEVVDPINTDPDNPIGPSPPGTDHETNPLVAPYPPVDPYPPVGPPIVIPYDPEPVVVITPQQRPRQSLMGVILRKVIKAILDKFGIQQLPGPIGQAISQAVTQYEQELIASLTQGAPVVTLPADAILELTAEHLGVTLNAQQRQQALQAWREYAALRLRPEYLDENGNQIVADDVVIWFVDWLHKNGLYEPARHFQIKRNNLGQPVIVISRDEVDPVWVEKLPPKIFLGGEREKAKTDSKSEQADDSKPAKEPEIPTAPAVVTVASTPDLVRVPVLAELTADVAADELAIVALNTNPSQKLFPDDLIVASVPQAHQWVKPLTSVDLDVVRRVPPVVGSSSKAAVEMLRDREFGATPDRAIRYRGSDEVLGQEPAGGDFAAPNTEIRLTVKRRVPSLSERTAAQAISLVKQHGFHLERPKGVNFTDIIVEQTPPSYQSDNQLGYAYPGDAIRIVRVETKVPDLQGSSLSSANTYSDAKHALATANLGFNFIGPETNYPKAKVLYQKPAAGERIDRTREQVSLQMVVPVPDLTQNYSVGKAKNILQQLGMRPSTSIVDYRPDDVVIAQNPVGQVHRAGKDKYFTPTTEFKLTVGRKVPPVEGVNWETALATLQDSGFQATRAPGSRMGTHVFSTTPRNRSVVDPREPVVLMPGIKMPDLKGQPAGEAADWLISRGIGVTQHRPSPRPTSRPDMVGKWLVRTQTYSAKRLIPMDGSINVELQSDSYGMPVPRFVDKRPEYAQRLAAERGLRLETSYGGVEPTNDPLLDGTSAVTDQDVGEGELVFDLNEPIQVIVSRYELQVQVPDFYRMEPWQAERLARDLGLRLEQVGTRTERSRDPEVLRREVVSRVTNQYTRPHVYVPRGTTIQVEVTDYVGDYSERYDPDDDYVPPSDDWIPPTVG